MTLYGVDCLDRAPVSALAGAGKSFVCRYLKTLTVSEIAALRAAGISLVLIYESTGVDFTGGFGQGQYDGNEAKAQCQALGVSGQPVYFAIDADTSLLTEVNAYLKGACAALGKPLVGVYGDDAVVSAAMAGSWCTWFWQTYAWSSGMLNPKVHLYQYLNGQSLGAVPVDYDRTVLSETEYGQVKWADPPEVDMYLVAYPNSGWALLTGSMFVLLSNTALGAFQAAGVKQVVVTQADFEAFSASAAKGALTAAQGQQLADTAAAVARIEAAARQA